MSKKKDKSPLGNIAAGMSKASNLDEIKRLAAAQVSSEKRNKRLNAQVPASLYDRFTATTKARGHNISALVRLWVEQYLADNE